MPTIKDVADRCGVSKSTAARKAKSLGINGQRSEDGRGTISLSQEEASALAHALTGGLRDAARDRSNRVSDEEHEPIQTESAPVHDRVSTRTDDAVVIRLYEGRIEDLKSQIVLMERQAQTREEKISRLEEELESKRTQLDMQRDIMADMREESERLKGTVELMRRAPLMQRVFGFKNLLPAGVGDGEQGRS